MVYDSILPVSSATRALMRATRDSIAKMREEKREVISVVR